MQWVYEAGPIRFSITEMRNTLGCQYSFYTHNGTYIAHGCMVVTNEKTGDFTNKRSGTLSVPIIKLADKIEAVYLLALQERSQCELYNLNLLSFICCIN